MKKLLFAIFAHPDDEAFGPCGTLLSETKQGTELHLITLTAGENGMNPDHASDLGALRLEEWYAAGKCMGASHMHYLGFTDGQLGNIAMLQVVDQIKTLVRSAVAAYSDPVEVEFMSMDTNGVTGHIDHIVASRAAHQVFYSLKREGLPLSRLRLACLPRERTGTTPNLDFVFMEPGRFPHEINETIDNRAYIDEVYAIMRTHKSQRSDCETHISRYGDEVAVNYFIIKR